MDSVSVNQFRDHLKTLVDQALDRHQPLKVTRRGGGDFIVIGAEDWEREQETLLVLQNGSLMRQIADSLQTHARGAGYRPTAEEIDAIAGV
jgi:antitoxin YefM